MTLGRAAAAGLLRPEPWQNWRECHAGVGLRAIRPRVAILLGSGLGSLADEVEEAVTIPYADLAGFPQPTAPGHAGRVTLGRLASVPVALLQGRVHLYEGASPSLVLRWLTALRDLGIGCLVATNASGSLRPTSARASSC